jgi:ABC-2 type transport system ATP-binding protein
VPQRGELVYGNLLFENREENAQTDCPLGRTKENNLAGTQALVCRDLVKAFDGTRAVDGLDMSVECGTIFGLLGPNGSGKTTTIRTCLGIYKPDDGSIELLGSRDPLAVRRRTGYLPEERGLYARMKVREQLAFLASIRGLDLAESDRRAGRWLERLDLASRAQSLTRELSKGMQQKVQFAAAVIHDPDLIVLDEPFSGLDPVNSRLLKDLIFEQRARGTTVILSTHRMEEVEAMCESICLMHHGRAVLSGRLKDIKAAYGRNTIAVEHDGTPKRLEGIPGVVDCQNSGREARLRIEVDADPQRVMRAILERVAVRSIRLDEPHIEDIYLEKIGVHHAAAAQVAPGAPV